MPDKSKYNYHVLLIGIDNYPPGTELSGCVNDIDAIQRILLEDIGVPAKQIQRLASPRAGSDHPTTIASKPAELDNIRAAFRDLGSEKVNEGDRVFIYYAGHGAQVRSKVDLFTRESIVPVDFKRPNEKVVLWDYEVNGLLRKIAQRTQSVAFVLDSCFAAGATRTVSSDLGGSRFVHFGDDNWAEPAPDRAALDQPTGTRGTDNQRQNLRRSVDDCMVVASCQTNQVAKEYRHAGKMHGLFTHAFLSALEGFSGAQASTLTWAKITQVISAKMASVTQDQSFWLGGHRGRTIFAGPPVTGDIGFPVALDGKNYQIEAGELADITPGAKLAIYGARPKYFPGLDSTEDKDNRLGTVAVETVEWARATAASITGEPFKIPDGARARLVEPGEPARIRYTLVPADSSLQKALDASKLLTYEPTVGKEDVALVKHDGSWFVTDDQHALPPDKHVLFKLNGSEIDCAQKVLEHYYAYSRPLRMAKRLSDLPACLEIQVLDCGTQALDPATAQAGDFPPCLSPDPGRYRLKAGARVCFKIINNGGEALRVTLVNSAASGKVQLLGDQTIKAGENTVFWATSNIGSPFVMTPPAGSVRCLDRLVAIGRTAKDHDLSYLRVGKTFAQVVQRSRGSDRDIEDDSPKPSVVDQWTATQVIIDTRKQ